MSRARRSGELPRFVGVALRPWIQRDHMIVPGKILDLGVPDPGGHAPARFEEDGRPRPGFQIVKLYIVAGFAEAVPDLSARSKRRRRQQKRKHEENLSEHGAPHSSIP